VSSGRAVRLPRSRPGHAALHRLYVAQQWSTADLAAHYRVGSRTVRQWLLEAGIEIRPRGSGGYRRQLTAPPRQELAELGRDLPTPAIAKRLGVSNGTVLRWFAEADLTPPSASLKNRPRGSLTPIQRPTADRLRQLYVDRFADFRAVPCGVTHGSGAAAGSAGVAECTADNIAPAGPVLAVVPVVGFAPAAWVLAERVVALVRQQRHMKECVDAVECGVPEPVGDDHEGAPADRPVGLRPAFIGDLEPAMSFAGDRAGP